MIKIAGRHKSVPRELKRSLTAVLPVATKVVMNDICSCRHSYPVGAIKLIECTGLHAKLRGYYGSGVVNFFVKFASEADKEQALNKLATG